MMRYVCSEVLDYGPKFGVVVRTEKQRIAFRGGTMAEAYARAREWIGDDAEDQTEAAMAKRAKGEL